MNVHTPVELVIMQFPDQVRIKLISNLIKDISRVLPKLLKYFNGTPISTSSVLTSTGVLPVIFALNLNDSESTMLVIVSSLNYSLQLQHHDLWHYLLMCYFIYTDSEWCNFWILLVYFFLLPALFQQFLLLL